MQMQTCYLEHGMETLLLQLVATKDGLVLLKVSESTTTEDGLVLLKVS